MYAIKLILSSWQTQLQNSIAGNRWQQWRLVPYPPRATAKVPNPTSAQMASQACTRRLFPSLESPQIGDTRGSTTESATVTVIEDEDSITTTRTTTSTTTMVEVNAKRHSDDRKAN
jgi:hypothetical protein